MPKSPVGDSWEFTVNQMYRYSQAPDCQEMRTIRAIWPDLAFGEKLVFGDLRVFYRENEPEKNPK
jgi:hypothetical protein